jgi:alpha-beta hydrolase superfamily lysophospholipase
MADHTPQSANSPIGTSAIVDRALRVASMLPPTSVARGAVENVKIACQTPPSPQPPPVSDISRCSAAIGTLYDEVVRETTNSDPATSGLARVSRIALSAALSRLTWGESPETDVDGAPSSRSSSRATVEVSGDGSVLRVLPERPLRAGRDYQLLVYGLPRDADPKWRAAGSGPSRTLEAELSESYDAVLSDSRIPFRDDDVRALIGRLATSASSLADVPGASGARALLRRPLNSRELLRLRAWFVPATPAPHPAAVIGFRTQNPLRELAMDRTAVARLSCDDSSATLEASDTGPLGGAVAGVYRGRYRSLDIVAPISSPAGAPAAQQGEHTFLLAVPTGFSERTPVVLAIHGHGGRADVMLKSTAQDLAKRGMATLAIDIAAHGARAGEEQFVDPLRPARLTRGIRQAAVDVLSMIDAATRCGFVLPDGHRAQPGSVRYLGYSLGAAIGVLVRSVEPRMGITVLLAPAADLVEWQVQQVPKRLGAESYTICSGGPLHGSRCEEPDKCRPLGICVFDPRVVLLNDVLTLPFRLVFGGADPLSFAVERTSGSTAPLLIVGGELDMTVGPLTAARLADAYGMTLDGSGGRRGAKRRFAAWPMLGHELFGDPRVRGAAYDFLEYGGRSGR